MSSSRHTEAANGKELGEFSDCQRGSLNGDGAGAHYGVTLRQANAVFLRGKCPLPSHSSESSKQSFGVQPAINVWCCWSASCVAARGGRRGGNVFSFVAAMESCSIREAALKLQAWLLSSPSNQTSPVDAPIKLVGGRDNGCDGRTDDDPDLVNEPLKLTLKPLDASHPYLAKAWNKRRDG
jgi:hypothetical protein